MPSRRIRWAAAAGGLAVVLPIQSGLAQEKYAGPEAPGVQPAARAALPGKVLPVEGRVIGIAGVSRGIDAVLEDLGARVTEQAITIDLSADVLFDFNEAEVKPEAAGELGKVAEVLRAHPAAAVTIEGHTDARGADDYNQRLSERRAEAIRAWLAANGGFAAERFSTRGWGETKPVAPNQNADGSDNPEGRQKNRRVEITMQRVRGGG